MSSLEPLETERFILREFRENDLADMHAVLGNAEVMRFSLSGPYTVEKTAGFLRGCFDGYQKRNVGLFALVLKEEQKVIGYCGFYFLSIDGADDIEIGYRLHPAYWNWGLATEAAIAVRDLGFERLGYRRVISCIEAANPASIRVAEKAGMTYEKEALFRDKIPVRIYALSNPGLVP